jgi:4-amino-4-deoxy-L-arabinose transferase-like glycosyltransferase
VSPVGAWMTASPVREAVVAGVLAFTLFFAGTASVPLIGRDEPRFAEAAREMLARDELVVPTFGGINRYDKPILIYWCTMASYAIAGVDERAARLPSNLAAAAAVMLLGWTARRRWGPGAGLLAATLMTVTMTFHVQAKACTADMVMMLPTMAAMLALERLFTRGGGTADRLVLWLGLGLATLAKGPVGPMVAAAAGVAWWALGRAWHRWEVAAVCLLAGLGWWRLGPVVLAPVVIAAVVQSLRCRQTRPRLGWSWGVPLFMLLVLPWALAADAATDGAFFSVGVGRHVVARSLRPLESHVGFPGFYLVTAVLVALPWAAMAPAALRERIGRLSQDAEARFLVAWLLGPLVVLELVQTKLVHYWMPSYPAGILLVTWFLIADRERRPPPAPSAPWLMAAGSLPLVVLPAGLALHLGLEHLVAPGLLAGVPLAGGALGFVAWWRCRRALAVGAVLAGAALFLVLLLSWYLPLIGPAIIGPKAAARALEIRRPGEDLLVYKARDDELFFYLPLDVVNCRPRQCLADLVEDGGEFLGVARVQDVERFQEEYGGDRLQVVEVVEGIDLGRGRWAQIALFRPAVRSPHEPEPAAITVTEPIGWDRQRQR